MNKQTQGKRNRQSGAEFERKVRADLKSKGWLVSKFMNNVELTELWSAGHKYSTDKPLGYDGKMIPAKRKYNPFKKALCIGTGFPDFICWRKSEPIMFHFKDKTDTKQINQLKDMLSKIRRNTEVILPCNIEIVFIQEVIGVECKVNGYLDKQERAKCEWLLKNKIFSKILIAKKKKVGRKIIPEYIEFNLTVESINRSLKQASKGQIKRIA